MGEAACRQSHAQSLKSQQGALIFNRVTWDNQGKLDCGLPGKQEYSVTYDLQRAIQLLLGKIWICFN